MLSPVLSMALLLAKPIHLWGMIVGAPTLGVNDTPVFLLNEYIVELNPANFNILNQILN